MSAPVLDRAAATTQTTRATTQKTNYRERMTIGSHIHESGEFYFGTSGDFSVGIDSVEVAAYQVVDQIGGL